MFNKFEAFGIAFSIGAMAIALWLIRLETTTSMVANVPATDQSAAVYAISAEDDTSFRNAFIEASGGDTTLERMIIDDITIGTGAEVADGDTVEVHYIGSLQNGQEFDNSYKKGTPFSFTVGEGRVIAGWEQGLIGMKVGGERVLVIPPELAYGKSGVGPIPGDATLVFAIELMAIK